MQVNRATSDLPLGSFRRSGRGLLLLFFLVSVTACREQIGPVAKEQTNLGWLGSMYGMYIAQNSGQTPKSVDELRKFVERRTNAEQLGRLKVANVNELFTSPRDGKTFQLVSYTKLPPRTGGELPPVVLYETTGQNGQRAVAFLGGMTKSVDESEFKKILPAQAELAR